MVWTLLFELNLKKIMKKQITYLFIYLIFLTTLQGQIVQERLPGAEEIINRSSPFNLEELKVRWKKAALENCPGVPCITSTVPGPPTTVTASAGNAQATISFTAPSSNGGSPITGYTVTSSPGGITATGATSPINVTGLTNGTPYTFTVVATNAIGNSVASSASTAVTPVAPNTVPGPPTSVVATAGNASASVAFVAPTNNGGSAITGYTVTSSPGGITATGATSPINVTGLTNGTAYTFTVVATNAIGNSVASSASTAVTPVAVCPTSTVTDVDNNIYNTVAIGTQCWTTSNLKVTKYNDGTAILLDASGGSDGVTGGENWSTQLSGAYTVYGNAPTNATNYGYLYNWYAVSDLRKLCPTGWHVPTRGEWNALASQLGGLTAAGGKLKSMGTTFWNSPNTGADNSSGFSGLPGGLRLGNHTIPSFASSYVGPPGSFVYVKDRGYFWSASADSSNPGRAYSRILNASNTSLNEDSFSRFSEGQYVRCLKD